MDIAKVLEDLRSQLHQVDEAILSFERMALGAGKRRGRPPAWMVAAKESTPRKRGRPRGSPKTGRTESFTSEKALAELAANWPASRLIDVFNSLPGVTPVKKFTDRKKAAARIWKAIQNLGGTEAPQSAHVAPEEAPAKKKWDWCCRWNLRTREARKARQTRPQATDSWGP